MLIEFTVGNYRSFKDPVTFSMVAAKLTARNKALDENNVFPLTDAISLLKSCAVYGPNASGKSNLVHAFRFMRHFVLNSSKDSQAGESINVRPFLLSTETENEPALFEITFFTDGKRFRYGFTVDAQKVHSEWLYHAKIKETQLFYREDGGFEWSSTFKEGKRLPEKTRDNALFLSVVAQFNGVIALAMLRWFRELKVMFGIEITDDRYFFDIDWEEHQPFKKEWAEDPLLRNEIISFVKQMDVGISDMEIKIEPDVSWPYPVPRVTTLHKRYDSRNTVHSLMDFDIDIHESEGTRKLFLLAGPILDVLRNGTVLIIDELDARLHPLLTESIIRLFNANETNPNNAQLVFTTHDTNLLTNKIFRRDQIWFTEKNKYGATDLYSLAEFKVRNDASFEKDYIAGKYGAIPFIGGLHRLVEGTDG